jgi:glyoxylase-like metal-dependent hydrolase (beta-lactamase superfamily II)
MLKKLFISLGLLLGAVVIAVGIFFLMYIYPFMSAMKNTTTIQYDPKLTIVLGGGGNSGILVSDSAVLVIDTKQDDAAKALAETVKKLAGSKHIIVINTHVHPDHTGGNKYYEGQTIIAGGNYDKDFWIKQAGDKGVPNVWVKDSLVLKFGDEVVTILNLPWPAHTQSDIFVYLQNRKMLFGGDVILNHAAPAMFSTYKADGYGYLKAFDYVTKRFDVQKVVPGHGPIGGIEVINNYRDFFIDMKVASLDAVKKDALIAKYKDWKQIPYLMSPIATEKYFEDNPNPSK